MRGRPIGDEKTDEACSLYRKGMALGDIAVKLDLTIWSVRSALRRRNVEMRKVGRPSTKKQPEVTP
jgi:hypothetical protein